MNNLINQRFGRLLVLKDSNERVHRGVIWECLCDCGNLIKIRAGHLQNGRTQSCGCKKRENAREMGLSNKGRYGEGNHPNCTHREARTRLYRIRMGMEQRTGNPNATGYELYGKRGIIVCPEWKNSYIAFRDWAMKNGYANNLCIDRIDNNGIYEPTNCQWISREENAKKMWRDS